jgi:type I restriction-modification system DNA methylase subunit
MEFHSTEQLKEYVHSIHDFIRNSGAGYGMTALKIFNVFYSLKLLDGKTIELGLPKECDWNNIKSSINNDKNEFEKKIYTAINQLRFYALQENKGDDPLSNIIGDLYNQIGELYEDKKIVELKHIYQQLSSVLDKLINETKKSKIDNNEQLNIIHFIYHQIPNDLKYDFCVELFKKVDILPIDNTESKKSHFDLKGKIYEYFIGRDKSAISELGAYFTDRYIINFIMNYVKPEMDNDNVQSMIDPFGGSGGFTLQYTDYINKTFSPNWSLNNNFMNIHHYDMSEDVVKIAAVEFYSLTNKFPINNKNFKRTNTFKENFKDKFKYVFSNPPYGGDKTTKTPDIQKRELIIERNKLIITELINEFANIFNLPIKQFEKDFKNECNFIEKKFICKVFDIEKDIIIQPDFYTEVDKLVLVFCKKNKVNFDDIKESIYKYIRLEYQNISCKKKNEKEIDDAALQKVNYDTCSQLIKDYAQEIHFNYNKITREEIIKKINKELELEEDNDKIKSLKCEQAKLQKELNDKYSTKFKVNKSNEIGFNDKEACSWALLMALLDKDGVGVGVLKEGVFFDGKYSKIRCHLINEFNVTDVISIDADAFENTTTKTSIIIFKNNGKTKNIKFHKLNVETFPDTLLDFSINSGNFITSTKDQIKSVSEEFICKASYKQLSEVKITYNKKKEAKFDLDYSLNYKNYKDYKVDCPEGYELKKLGKEFTYKQKANRPASFANENGKYRFYTSSDKIKRCDECDFTDNELKIIMGTGGVGSLFIDTKFTCSSDNFVITTDNIYNTLYIYDYIKNNWKSFIDKMFGGSTLGHINKVRLNNLEIPFPVDINKLKPQLDKIYNLHQQISSNTNLIPQKEKDVMDLIKKLTDEGKNGIDYNNNNFNNMIEYQKKSIKYHASHGKKEGKFHFYTSSQETILFTNDKPLFNDTMLIMGRKGDVSVHYDIDFSCESDDVYVMKVNDIDTRYMCYYIKINKEWFKEQMNGTTVKGTSKDILGKFIVKVLKEEVMKKYNIQKLFDEIDELKNNLESNKTNYQKELKELFKDFKNDDEEENETSSIPVQDNQEEQSSENNDTTNQDQEQEDDDEDTIISYKGDNYIVIDDIMYPYDEETETKGEAFGTFIDGKVKKYKK